MIVCPRSILFQCKLIQGKCRVDYRILLPPQNVIIEIVSLIVHNPIRAHIEVKTVSTMNKRGVYFQIQIR